MEAARQRKPRSVTRHEPIGVSIREALQMVPIGRSTLFEILKSGKLKSKLVCGQRVIDYRSLREMFEGHSEFKPGPKGRRGGQPIPRTKQLEVI